MFCLINFTDQEQTFLTEKNDTLQFEKLGNWSHSQSTYEKKTFQEFLQIISRKYIYHSKIKQIITQNVIEYLKNILEENFKRDITKNTAQKDNIDILFDIGGICRLTRSSSSAEAPNQFLQETVDGTEIRPK